MMIVSYFFNISHIAIYYILVVFIIIRHAKNLKRQDVPGTKRLIALCDSMFRCGITYTLIGLIYAALKFGVNLPRPFCAEEIFRTAIDISQERCLSSFPSAHTAMSIMITYYVWPFVKLPVRIVCIITCIFVMISRIVLAMHYPADIVWSAIISFVIIKLSNMICDKVLPYIYMIIHCLRLIFHK